ncbi:MAG: MBL fold metallo-hydrolase, partial [Gemmataceae bacterium]|nr:MBL fold metallo-hydrolase [Gemmataceae bacterium]
MALRFCVLGSGSSGNASYVEADGYSLLLDIGLGPRRIGRALKELGVGWEQIRAVVLTHGHADHWDDHTFQYLVRYQVPCYCHPNQSRALLHHSARFVDLHRAGLVRPFHIDHRLELGPLRATPFAVPHDDEPTVGFRIESRHGTLGYAADLGSWSDAIVDRLRDAEILAVEFNHDVALERNSGRSPLLIERVLSDHGHLSNDQAAELVTAVLQRSMPGR